MTAPPEVTLTRLAWDSDAFGFPVARIDGVSAPAAQLAAARAGLAREAVELAYWEWPSADPAGRAAAAAAGAAFINTRVTLVHSAVESDPSRAPRIVTTPTPAEHEALVELALAAGWQSRFALDPAFPPDRFAALYRTWMIESLSGKLADAVIVVGDGAATDGPAIHGMVTVSADGAEGSIGLFGVAPAARGRGVGRALLADALAWFAGRGCVTAKVVTQGENAAALAIYHAAGFTIRDCRDVFHFWNRGA